MALYSVLSQVSVIAKNIRNRRDHKGLMFNCHLWFHWNFEWKHLTSFTFSALWVVWKSGCERRWDYFHRRVCQHVWDLWDQGDEIPSSSIISSVRSSNSHPDLLVIHHHHPTHFFRSHRSSTLDFHFLSHYSYIKAIKLYKGNQWTHLLAICIPYGYNRTSLQDSAR